MTLAYKLISAWFIITAPIILWDAGYIFLRPRSMKGGDLHWIWKPYELYQEVDYIYGTPALVRNDGFPAAQSLLNVIETALNLYYVYLANIVQSPAAPVIGLISIAMTLSKTVLYWAQEYYCNWCDIGHNNAFDLVLLWILPNGLWIVVPTMIMYKLGGDVAVTLRAQAKRAGTKSQ